MSQVCRLPANEIPSGTHNSDRIAEIGLRSPEYDTHFLVLVIALIIALAV